MKQRLENEGQRHVYGGRNGWAFQIQAGMRTRDLPEWFRVGVGDHEGGMTNLRFHHGKFFHVTWEQLHHLDWPVDSETEIRPGDWLFAEENGGTSLLLRQEPVELAYDY